jgi:hypothetical protein
VGLLATGGIALLMRGGVILRMTIKDKVIEIVPAAFFMVVACVILYASLV